jgi:hypothetical protein
MNYFFLNTYTNAKKQRIEDVDINILVGHDYDNIVCPNPENKVFQ